MLVRHAPVKMVNISLEFFSPSDSPVILIISELNFIPKFQTVTRKGAPLNKLGSK